MQGSDSIELELSFCITCKNRFHQICKTLPQNLIDNAADQSQIEFVLVDFGSTDGLAEWVVREFRRELQSGYLRFYRTDRLPYWHAAVAKNTAHRLARGKILTNLDCDNFTGSRGAAFVRQIFETEGRIVLHQRDPHNKQTAGNYGRISYPRSDFLAIGGYDETLLPVGFEDKDVIHRLIRNGLRKVKTDDSRFNRAIFNSKEEGMKYCAVQLPFTEMDRLNGLTSAQHIAQGRLVANDGRIGIMDGIHRIITAEDLATVIAGEPAKSNTNR
eukprot:TRINITY_DN13516_c0_g1_i1.p1 TRINITY_DN13516_c0_g1~~TRINITY_DN13516_c0_g1_i1.p1  ORF type:complete len:272 (+),score=43.68 TRINITY_DN13516_c0_g1_i1:54-869(+)